jgi:transposase
MSLPDFDTQGQLFSTAALTGKLFKPTDRYLLFAKKVYPHLVAARPQLEKCYCTANGRVAIEPVLMLGVSLLQALDGIPDRQAVELLRYHAGWNLALNQQLGDAVFHPTSLVNFRHRLEEHEQKQLIFKVVLEALVEAGLVSRRSSQRLDSTQMLGRVAKMSRLDCVRESLRLALQELEKQIPVSARPLFWGELWDKYVESEVNYKSNTETLARKLREAGMDTWRLLEWSRLSDQKEGPHTTLLRRVFEGEFQVIEGPSQPSDSKTPCPVDPSCAASPVPPGASNRVHPSVEPKEGCQLEADRVQNPHDPEATYAVKGLGQQKKEHVGYKVQVAETVSEAVLEPGEPTRNFLVGIVTQQAHQSDEAGAKKMEEEQRQMGLGQPPVLYVDGAYVSAGELARAHAQERELIGPAQSSIRKEGRWGSEDFQVWLEERKARCPMGQMNSQCSRLEETSTGKVNYRFEFATATCQSCPERMRCMGKNQKHRTLVVGEHHGFLQTRRQEQRTEAFKQRMKHRHGIEGTQSELVRGYGMRHARYRGLSKSQLQNYFIGAACNVARWLRRESWKLTQHALNAPQALAT